MTSVNRALIQYRPNFMGRKVLITGGAGFIGSNLAKALVSLGATVVIVDSMIPEYGGNLRNLEGITDKVNLNFSDVRDPHSFRFLLEDIDYLFNLAGQTSHIDSMENPFHDLAINAHAQLQILELVREVNATSRIIFASTRQIYGRPQRLPVDETHPLSPVDINGIHKIAGEHYHTLFHEVYGLQTTSLRLTNTYGPGMRIRDARQTFLGIWINNALQGRPISVFGDGFQRRDFNFVTDVIDALLRAAVNPAAVGKVYNLGGPEVIRLLDLAKLLVEVMEREVPIHIVEFPEDRKKIDIGDFFGDFSLIKKELGWKPIVGLEEGLKTTVEFFEENYVHYA